MKIIYVAGPYKGYNHHDILQNILNASRLSIECWKKGWAVICPHKNTAGFDACQTIDITDDTWIQGDIEILKRCDAIIMTHDWKDSIGATKEHNIAKERNMEVYYHIQRLPNLTEEDK